MFTNLPLNAARQRSWQSILQKAPDWCNSTDVSSNPGHRIRWQEKILAVPSVELVYKKAVWELEAKISKINKFPRSTYYLNYRPCKNRTVDLFYLLPRIKRVSHIVPQVQAKIMNFSNAKAWRELKVTQQNSAGLRSHLAKALMSL